jgi:hypothetical protein
MKPSDKTEITSPKWRSLFGLLVGFGIGAVISRLGALFFRKQPTAAKVSVQSAPAAFFELESTASGSTVEPSETGPPSAEPLPCSASQSNEPEDLESHPERESVSEGGDAALVEPDGLQHEIPNGVTSSTNLETSGEGDAALSSTPASEGFDVNDQVFASPDHLPSPFDSQQVEEWRNNEAAHRPTAVARVPDAATLIHEKSPRPPTAPRARPIESSAEYKRHVASLLPATYLEWNQWIVKHILASARRDQSIYLSITPTVLSGIASSESDSSPSAQDAEVQFALNAKEVQASIAAQEGRLRILRSFDEEGLPLCAAYLAMSVLAAYRMQSDEEVSGGAYYYRLADLLGCDMVGGYPYSFDPTVFESLWLFLQTWLAERTGAHLAMPGQENSARRFVALPLTHVPLRRLDIEKLPVFFGWAGYNAGARVAEARLLSDLQQWARSYAALSTAGASALADERRLAVVSQVAQELAVWDGTAAEYGGRRNASVEIMLDIVRYRPDLFYLPRRPEGFPAYFDDGVHVLNAGDDRWYEPLSLLADAGPELSHGFEWRSTAASLLGFRRPPSAVIALAPSPDSTGFLSRSSLPRGASCAVLCQSSLAGVAGDYLSATAGRTCTPIMHSNVPLGWTLFTNVKPDRYVEVPNGLDALALDSQVNIICSGGLRLGRRAEWLAGSPPKIVVTGVGDGDVVTLDEELMSLGEDGSLLVDGKLSEPGVHYVRAGGVRRTVEIVRPRIGRAAFQPPIRNRKYVALPPGQWALIGADPGSATGVVANGRPGGICSADFDPVWAISVGAGPGATVMSLTKEPPPPLRELRPKTKVGGRVQQWAALIYSAAVRRPALRSLSGPADDRAKSVWRDYVRAVKQMKRQWRSR